MISSPAPVVAVWMLTYNHKRYIAQAIDGVINQKTSFHFKLYIGEDCSTDGTREICLEYKINCPKQIELLLTTKNSIIENSRNTYKACINSGARYIAMCEGDDYWTDPLKLQKQVDFMEANPDFAICYHRVEELRVDGTLKTESLNVELNPKVYTIEDLAKGNMINTPSVLYRNGLIDEFPILLQEEKTGDYLIHLLNARKGKIYYMPDVMAVYRVGIGIHGSLSKLSQLNNWAHTLQLLLQIEWTPPVRKQLMRSLKLIRLIIRRNKYKSIYDIRDAIVRYSGLGRLKKLVTGFKANE